LKEGKFAGHSVIALLLLEKVWYQAAILWIIFTKNDRNMNNS